MSMRSTTSATRASSTTASRRRLLTSRGSDWGSIAAYATGIVGRGVLLDAARHRGVDWLEPGEAVTRAELEAIEAAQGVRLGEGDILVFRTGHHARRLALGAWSNDYPPAGEGKAGLHVDTVPWMHERRIAAFLPDGDGETVPSNVEGMPYPIHAAAARPRWACASPTACSSRSWREACEAEGRWEFMVVGPAAAPARRHRLALEPDRHLLSRAATRRTPWNAVSRARSRSSPERPPGIGQATAVRLAAEGALVGVNQRRAPTPTETLRLVKEAGGEAFPVVADMRDPAAVTAMVAGGGASAAGGSTMSSRTPPSIPS